MSVYIYLYIKKIIINLILFKLKSAERKINNQSVIAMGHYKKKIRNGYESRPTDFHREIRFGPRPKPSSPESWNLGESSLSLFIEPKSKAEVVNSLWSSIQIQMAPLAPRSGDAIFASVERVVSENLNSHLTLCFVTQKTLEKQMESRAKLHSIWTQTDHFVCFFIGWIFFSRFFGEPNWMLRLRLSVEVLDRVDFRCWFWFLIFNLLFVSLGLWATDHNFLMKFTLLFYSFWYWSMKFENGVECGAFYPDVRSDCAPVAYRSGGGWGSEQTAWPNVTLAHH